VYHFIALLKYASHQYGIAFSRNDVHNDEIMILYNCCKRYKLYFYRDWNNDYNHFQIPSLLYKYTNFAIQPTIKIAWCCTNSIVILLQKCHCSYSLWNYLQRNDRLWWYVIYLCIAKHWYTIFPLVYLSNWHSLYSN